MLSNLPTLEHYLVLFQVLLGGCNFECKENLVITASHFLLDGISSDSVRQKEGKIWLLKKAIDAESSRRCNM